MNSHNKPSPSNLASFHGRRIAVDLYCGERHTVVRGVARFRNEETLGNILSIRLEGHEDAAPEIIISEEDWDGRVIRHAHGCEFCFVVSDKRPQ